ncbi:MAG: gephyrin-like molybdotransferase Glp [Bacteroidota bacterium]
MHQDISYKRARDLILATATPLPSENVRLADLLGRILAEPVQAAHPVPPFDASAMDGVAVRTGDLPTLPAVLPIAGQSWAGSPFDGVMPTGTAVEIATGAVVPPEADAVVPVEWTRGINGEVTIMRRPEPSHAIRRSGSAVAARTQIVEAGTAVTPAIVGALASVGVSEASCVRRPVVRIVITGDEVVPAGAVLQPGQIHDANGPTISAQVTLAGGLPEVLHVSDKPDAVIEALAPGADVVLITGGVSVGKRDRVRDELREAGVEWEFWRVRQRPGKPLLFGRFGDVPVLGLPGNPVSASVGVEVYLRPLLARRVGRFEPPRRERARLSERLPKAHGLHTFARVTASRAPDGVLELTGTGSQASHAVLSLLGDGLAHLPAEWDDAPPGAEVDFEPFAWRLPLCSSVPSA